MPCPLLLAVLADRSLRQVAAPFMPSVASPMCTANFDKQWTSAQVRKQSAALGAEAYAVRVLRTCRRWTLQAGRRRMERPFLTPSLATHTQEAALAWPPCNFARSNRRMLLRMLCPSRLLKWTRRSPLRLMLMRARLPAADNGSPLACARLLQLLSECLMPGRRPDVSELRARGRAPGQAPTPLGGRRWLRARVGAHSGRKRRRLRPYVSRDLKTCTQASEKAIRLPSLVRPSWSVHRKICSHCARIYDLLRLERLTVAFESQHAVAAYSAQSVAGMGGWAHVIMRAGGAPSSSTFSSVRMMLFVFCTTFRPLRGGDQMGTCCPKSGTPVYIGVEPELSRLAAHEQSCSTPALPRLLDLQHGHAPLRPRAV